MDEEERQAHADFDLALEIENDELRRDALKRLITGFESKGWQPAGREILVLAWAFQVDPNWLAWGKPWWRVPRAHRYPSLRQMRRSF